MLVFLLSSHSCWSALDKLVAVKFVRAGRVRLSFRDPEVCEEVLRSGFEFHVLPICLAPADDRLRNVYLRDLAVEIEDNEAVSSFFSDYGEVLSVDHCCFDDFPTVRNGNGLVKILLAQEIPCFVRVESCDCRVW